MTEPCKHKGWHTYRGNLDKRSGTHHVVITCTTCGAVLSDAPMQTGEAMTDERKKAEELAKIVEPSIYGVHGLTREQRVDVIESALLAAKAEERERVLMLINAYVRLNGITDKEGLMAEIRGLK